MNRRAFLTVAAAGALAPRDLTAPTGWTPLGTHVGVDYGSSGGDATVASLFVYESPRLRLLGTFERAEGETDQQLLDRVVSSLGVSRADGG